MLQESLDLLAEVEEFHDFLLTLDESEWQKNTGFMNWTPWDVVAHLHYFDLVSQTAFEGEEPFKVRRDALIRSIGKGMTP